MAVGPKPLGQGLFDPEAPTDPWPGDLNASNDE
jgi:hypothetical protein